MLSNVNRLCYRCVISSIPWSSPRDVRNVRHEEDSQLSKVRVSRKEFLRLGAATGLGASVAPLVLGCGDQSSVTEEASGSVNVGGMRIATDIEPAVGPGETIAKESEVATNAAVRFIDAEMEQPAELIHLPNGRFVAYSALCTHEGCPVFYQPDSHTILCPCHGAVFDPAEGGACVVGPAQAPLEEIEVGTRDGEVVRL
jgi:Rieske Fe-S protein